MLTFLGDLPLHPLVVHAVVVLVPLTVLGAVVAAVWPAARRRFGVPVVACGVLALVSTYVAQEAGEGLERYLPRDPAIMAHTHMGGELLKWVALLTALVAAFVLLHRRADRSARREGPGTTTAPALTGPTRLVSIALTVLIVAVALYTAYKCYEIGDSGARAVWGGRTWQVQPGNSHDGGG